MLICSFFTGVGRYRELAARLAASCDRHGYRRVITELGDAGEWQATVGLKPACILTTLMDYREPVLWVDSDCAILRPIPAFAPGVDFAAYNWHADATNHLGIEHNPSRLMASGGVLYFDYTAPALELLSRWATAIREYPAVVDDRLLDAVYNQIKPPVTSRWLPREMNWMTGHFGETTPETVIRHDYVGGGHRESTAPIFPVCQPSDEDE